VGFDKPSLKGRALRLLAQREHSRAELLRKLAAHEEWPGELAQALDELQAKGLPAEAVALAVEELRGSELPRAREVWRKKFGRAPVDANEWARQARFLLARGFDAGVARRVIGDADHEDVS
jgi:regulatory protein